MTKLKGTGLSPGIVIGKAVPIYPATLELPCRSIVPEETDAEIARFHDAVSTAARDIGQLLDGLFGSGPERDILEAQQMILQDPELDNEVSSAIRSRNICAENAVQEVFARLVDFFRNTRDEYLSQRAGDYREVGRRLIHRLLGAEDEYPPELPPGSVLLMEEIPAVLVMRYSGKGLAGMAAERGSRTGHAAIVARALGIPFVSGFPELLRDTPQGHTVALDGELGECVVDPDESTLSLYRHLRAQYDKRAENLGQLINLETRTRDDIRIHLRCNIGFPAEIDQVGKLNAEGVGLFRTEFLFMNRDTPPDEEEQYAIYREVAERCAPHEVIIRTIDAGGDKFASSLNLEAEANPNLGIRGIRISLKYPELFRIQLRAILRAAAHGNINLMFPMVTSLEEFRQAKRTLNECKLELKREGLDFRAEVPTGIMIEVPSAALMSDAMAAEVDFFSIGTNDLVQYTLAVDRNSENVPEIYNPYHPAVLQLITLVVQNARKHNIPVGICGEMASDRDFIPFLIGLGIPELSVSPGVYLSTKEWIMSINSEHLIDLVLDLLEKPTSAEVQEVIAQWRKKHGTTL